MSAQPDDFDKLWNYQDPAATEAKFREVLSQMDPSADANQRLELLTQIARTQGLQGNFDQAHRTLDGVEAKLDESSATVRARYLLERGRALNSGGKKAESSPLFEQAWELCKAEGLDGYAVDAAHMLGIVEAPAEALKWNEKAMAYAEASDDEKAKKWLGALYNNVGWTHHDAGRFDAALDSFERGLVWRNEHQPGTAGARIAKWTVGRALRSLGRADEACALQHEVETEWEGAGEPDGFVFEELGECYQAKGDAAKAAPYFAKAYPLLNAMRWLADSEPERLERIKTLGGL